MNKFNLDDTIVAVSTPIGEGGIGIVRLSGERALEIADVLFASRDRRKVSDFGTYTVHYGHIVDKGKEGIDKGKEGGRRVKKGKRVEVIDEVILTVMRAPKSYTREDVVEINCHGGIQAVKRVLEMIVKCGARIAEPGEFTKRAFLNGRIDLAQAEAVLDTIRAKTEGSLKVAMSMLSGGLSEEVNSVMEDVIDIASQVEASLDFPEEGLDAAEKPALIRKTKDAMRRLKSLIDTYADGMVFREGVLAIICGKPNVGKSSLMNLLLKRDRVIVSPIPGTTRDTVEETINLKGVPIRLVDTAGIAATDNSIEREGVRRSKQYLELADIVLLMLDGTTRIGKQDRDIARLIDGKKRIVLVNKSDLKQKIDKKEIKRLFKDEKAIEISVTKRRNIERLEKAILDMVWSGKFAQGEGAVVSNARHKALLDKSYGCMLSVEKALAKEIGLELVAIDLKEAIFNLGLIIGRSVSEDILDRIFERFCIGK